jgi:hypothetical protein
MAMVALPFMAGIASAATPLSNDQMDTVTAGYTATSVADAEGLTGKGSIVETATATLAQVTPFAFAVTGETVAVVFKSISAAQSATATVGVPTIPLQLSSPVG